MKAKHVLYTWDYHHGQATRVIAGGLPPLRGASMAEKQDYFARHCDHLRASLMQEPRGHRNMLGAVLTEPATPDGDLGMLFLHPQGYFEMCGDSTFSAAAAAVDAGLVPYSDPDGELLLKVDTVAGRVDIHIQLRAGEPVAITFDNVPAYSLGAAILEVDRLGPLEARLGYGGLTYAFVEARAAGLESLKSARGERLLETGTRVWRAAREQLSPPSYAGPERLGAPRPVDLITLWEPLDDTPGARVANFYAPNTCGRTPSGTGLAARVAVEAAAGRLQPGGTYVHESPLGLRFLARAARTGIPRAGGGQPGVVAAVTARSYLMGTAQWVLHPEDPFIHGFIF